MIAHGRDGTKNTEGEVLSEVPTPLDAGEFVMQRRYAIARELRCHKGNGEGGIRTLGSLLDYGALAKRCFRPLSHLTQLVREYGVRVGIVNQSGGNGGRGLTSGPVKRGR